MSFFRKLTCTMQDSDYAFFDELGVYYAELHFLL
jgi:hypothetical protein